MDPRYRAAYNAAYDDATYRRYAANLERRLGTPIPFRLAETPVFLPPDFLAETERAAQEILTQLCEPARIAMMERAVPERWNVPGRDALPTVAILDFAAVRENGKIVPRLIELQGFPSLLGFSFVQAQAWDAVLATIAGLHGKWTSSRGLSDAAYVALARRAIVAQCDPQTVALVDLDPEHQKTLPDFRATKELWGVDAADVRSLCVRGRKLFRTDPATGREVPVERIYYRLVIDELERSGTTLPFDLRQELDVQWSPHPNWFWIWSKVSLPYLDHPAVPRTTLLAELDAIPADLSGYVLKPLFSFAGGGVNVAPTHADVEAIPRESRRDWCLQERVEYAPVIPAADGGEVKVEVRLMFLRPDDAAGFTLAQNLCRLSRGAMIGVDYNRDRTWVGSSVGLVRS